MYCICYPLIPIPGKAVWRHLPLQQDGGKCGSQRASKRMARDVDLLSQLARPPQLTHKRIIHGAAAAEGVRLTQALVQAIMHLANACKGTAQS